MGDIHYIDGFLWIPEKPKVIQGQSNPIKNGIGVFFLKFSVFFSHFGYFLTEGGRGDRPTAQSISDPQNKYFHIYLIKSYIVNSHCRFRYRLVLLFSGGEGSLQV